MLFRTSNNSFLIRKASFWRSPLLQAMVAGALITTLVVSMIQPASAAIAYRANSTTGGNGSSMTINKPAGALDGDIIILSVSIRTDTASVTCPNGDTPMNNTAGVETPIGFTTISTQSANADVTSFYKFVTASEPASYTAALSGTCAKAAGGFGSGSASAKFAAVAVAYSGVDMINPINVFGSQATSGATLTAPSVTTTATNTMLVSMFSTPGAETLTSGNVTVRNQAVSTGGSGGTKNTIMVGDGPVAASGATGTRTASNTGTGNGASMTVALNTQPVLSQAGYRWFANSTTAGTVGSALANQDTQASAPSGGQPFRLRLLIGVSDGPLSSTTPLKLQYKWQQSGVCDTTGGFADVTTSSPVKYYDNPGVSDAASIVTSGSDPVRSGVTKVIQTYEESNNFTTTTTVPVGQDGMWDFALTLSADADDTGQYCFLVVTATGQSLNMYSQIPSLKLSIRPTSISGQEHRFFQNIDSAVPSSALGTTNAPITLGATGDQFRLRAGLQATGYFKNISSGGNNCALSSHRQVYCWGNDSEGSLGNNPALVDQSKPTVINMFGVLLGKSIDDLSTGSSTSCVIASDKKIYCWGFDSSGQLGNDATLASQSTPVAVDMNGVLAGKTISDVSIGVAHVCVIASDGKAYCWGNDLQGQLGNDATLASQSTPVAVDMNGVLAGKTLKSISAGSYHTCAIANDDKAYCWGDDSGNGQLGNDASYTDQPTPVAVNTAGVLSGKTILSIAGGDGHTCVISSDNLSYCWGDDFNGQLGNGATTGSQPLPVSVSTTGVLSGKTILQISTGSYHTCVIASDSKAYCWGEDDYGQLGDNTAASRQVSPVAVNTSGALAGKNIAKISAGNYSTCAISSDNISYCWGIDTYGQVGNGLPLVSQGVPVLVDVTNALSNKSVTGMSLGNGWGCALGSSQGYCWGSDIVGQLGDDTDSVNQSSAVTVSTSGVLSGKTINSISGRKDHTCVIASDNLAYCWGGDASGQLGDDATLANQRVPVAVNTTGVLSGKTISKLSAGSDHSCAIASDNLGYCWGAGIAGRLGNGSVTTQGTPVAVTMSGVLAGKTLKQISAGFGYTCTIASDDKAYCWGESDNGRLGTGSFGADALTPVMVSDTGVLAGKTLSSISAGYDHTCVIASDNLGYCWGSDLNGQLGNGTATGDQASPVAINMTGALAGKTIQSISAGKGYTCVIASDNLPYCWGINSSGQLGTGNLTSVEESPIAVSMTGALAGKTMTSIFSGFYDQTCVIANDNRSYCWGVDSNGQLGDNFEQANQDQPVPVSDSLLNASHIASNSLAIRLYYAQKTLPTCQAQTGFAAVTNATPIAFSDNASVTNGSIMVHGSNNPVTNRSIMPQGYYDSLPTSVTNQNLITHTMTNVWDLSLRDNGAPASTTYCLRLVGDAGDNFGRYESYPEVTTAVASGGGSDTNAGLLRGGQAVLNGVKQIFSW